MIRARLCHATTQDMLGHAFRQSAGHDQHNINISWAHLGGVPQVALQPVRGSDGGQPAVVQARAAQVVQLPRRQLPARAGRGLVCVITSAANMYM